MKDDGPGNDRENTDENDEYDPGQKSVQVIDAARQGGNGQLQVEFLGGIRDVAEHAEQPRQQQPRATEPRKSDVAIVV